MGEFSGAVKNKVTQKMTGFNKLVKRVTPLGDFEAHVGVIASKGGGDYHKGAAESGQMITLVELAAIHEFGSPAAGIPERSFIRATFNSPEGQEELRKVYTKVAKLVVMGRMEAERAIEILGMHMQTMIRQRILTGDGIPPPNTIDTIVAKGSSRPLVDTGQLVGAISWQTVKKK